MLLGTAVSTSDSQEDFEEKARMILQQSEGDGLDADSIKKLSKFSLCKTKDIYELKGQLKTCICFFSIILGEHSVVTLQLSQLYQKLKINKLKLIANFKRDPFFGIKLFYQINRCLVQFFDSCEMADDIKDVCFDLVDLSHISMSILREQFMCNLPTSLSGSKRPPEVLEDS
jgi:hypothetical protein